MIINMDNQINKQFEEAKEEIERVVVGLFADGVSIEIVKNALKIDNDELRIMYDEQYKQGVDWARRLASENYKYKYSIEYIEDLCKVDRKEFIHCINKGEKKE
jgi:hypothetical protein